MTLTVKPMRYAHPEGHTDVCYYTGNKGGFITCGTDGDVRAWLDLLDDDPSASCVADQATTVISKDGKVIVGHDSNVVQILSYPDLEKEGIVTRFSSIISALATTRKSDLIVSGSCDMRIQVSNWKTLNSSEFIGHDAPILGLSLDPKEEFFASSSADGTVRIWHIKDRCSIKTWNNVVPKSNSFLTAKVYGSPSFETREGKYLAYPHGTSVVVNERSTWNELFRLKCSSIAHELSICKFSECGKFLAATSTHGEIVVWNVESQEVVGFINHPNDAKITAFAWRPDKPTEIAFCDASGEFGCIAVEINSSSDRMDIDAIGDAPVDEDNDDLYNNIDNFKDDDDDNNDDVIDISKIKASVALEDDQKSISSVGSTKKDDKRILTEVNLQAPFQPGSSPVHLMSRYMVWNNVGVVTSYESEDGDNGTIEANFHDATVHHSMHVNNYLRHTMAALSNQALALACPSQDGEPSKIVTVVLQGWGSGNKEWTIQLPEGEDVVALATGSCFVAAATSMRTLRIFLSGGTQREVLSLPGQVVTMNGHGNNLAVAYHAGFSGGDDQILRMLWIRVCGPNLRSYDMAIPLSPASRLMWLGFSDLGSPVAMDAEGILSIYDKRSCLWRVACDTTRLNKGKFDHYFVIGVEESTSSMRCILCKGSHYPPVTPRPIVGEVPLKVPLCEPDTDKTEKEEKLWQFGTNPVDEKEAMLSLIAQACRNNVEYRAVDLCQQIASQKVIEFAIKYAARMHKMALANKLESIAETKGSNEVIKDADSQKDIFETQDYVRQQDENDDVSLLPISAPATPEIEIRPLSPSQPFGRRSNPFLKKASPSISKGLAGLDVLDISSPKSSLKPAAIAPSPLIKRTKQSVITNGVKKVTNPITFEKPTRQGDESFTNYYLRNKRKLQEQYPELGPAQLAKKAMSIFDGKDEELAPVSNGHEQPENKESEENSENLCTKKRKLATTENEEQPEEGKAKRSIADRLSIFAAKS